MTTPPNTPDPRDPNAPRDPGAGAGSGEPRYGQRLPQAPQSQESQSSDSQPSTSQPQAPGYGQPDPAQPYTPYAQPGFSQDSSGQQPPSPYGQPYGQQPQSPYGYQAAQPSGYAYPAARDKPEKGPAPREVLIGFWLILAAGVMTAISFISSAVAVSGSVLDMLPAEDRETFENSGMTEEMLSNLYVGIGVVLALLAFLIYALIAFMVRRGKNWARILGTVFASMSLVGLLFSVMGSAMGMGQLNLVTTLGSLAGIAGIVMLYLPPSRPYFVTQPRFGPY